MEHSSLSVQAFLLYCKRPVESIEFCISTCRQAIVLPHNRRAEVRIYDSRHSHIEIANALDTSPITIRRLVEQTHHYYSGDEHFLLKQTISNIENFLFIFNPFTKYDLCRYWQTLEEKGYDPVNEYNKRLEMFDMQYAPAPRDLFIVILQVSRFFKEFAEFETMHTPKFRHPYIKGKVIQRPPQEYDPFYDDPKYWNKKINIQDFLDRKRVIHEPSEGEKFDRRLEWPFHDQNDEPNFSEVDTEAYHLDPDTANRVEFLVDIGLSPEINKMGMTEDASNKQGLQSHEAVNIEVECGRVYYS